MDGRNFDALMRRTLEEKAEDVSMTEAGREKIFQAISDHSKEERRMKIGFKQKMAVVAAAMCLCGTIVAVAAGKVKYYGTSSSHTDDIRTFAEMSDVRDRAGFDFKAVEKFSNGFEFEFVNVSDTVAYDDNGQEMEKFPEVMVRYKRGNTGLFVNAEKARPEYTEPTTGNPVKIPYNGITLIYNEDHYKFVPPDYEPTEEDKKAEESGELYISYGSSEVELKTFHAITWDDGDMHYLIMTSDEGAPGQDEMAEMAKEIIDAPEI